MRWRTLARRALLSAITALIALAVTLPAASASSHTTTVAGKTVTPKQWAGDVCPGLTGFVAAYQEISKSVAGSSSAAEVQAALVSAIDDAATAAQAVVRTIRKAGVPGVKNGQRSIASLVTEFKRIRTSLDAAGGQVDELDADDPQQFASDLTTIEQTANQKVSASLNNLDSINPKLQKALQANAECAAI